MHYLLDLVFPTLGLWDNLLIRFGIFRRKTMYMSRTLEDKIRILRSYFPVVSLTGPRQSGKSTLLREIFRDYVYVNLETPQVRKEAQDDPVTFIKNRGRKLIIDEAQYVP